MSQDSIDDLIDRFTTELVQIDFWYETNRKAMTQYARLARDYKVKQGVYNHVLDVLYAAKGEEYGD